MLLSTGTVTFCERAENHVGMQQIGGVVPDGFNLNELHTSQLWFDRKEVKSNIYDLKRLLPIDLRPSAEDAYLLHAPNGLSSIVNVEQFTLEQNTLVKDKHAYMYGRVVNKLARHNLCFASFSQEPNYEEKKGRIVAFNTVPLFDLVRRTLSEIIGPKGDNMVAEGNYYYDITKCGIGFHGDSERKRVIATRFGATMPLDYQWFYQSNPVGDRCRLQLNNGDIYIMSEKAVGTDWKTRNKLTLRHAAGSEKYLTIK